MMQARHFFISFIIALALPVTPVAAQTADEQNAQPESAPATQAAGSVARAAFTTAINDREPVDDISNLTTSGGDTVYFFTELKDLQGQTVIHRWQHNGEAMADVKLQVGGPRWRVWSSKKLQDDWTGTWKVSVIDGQGNEIASRQFQYEKAAVAAEPAAAANVADTTATTDDASTPASE